MITRSRDWPVWISRCFRYNTIRRPHRDPMTQRTCLRSLSSLWRKCMAKIQRLLLILLLLGASGMQQGCITINLLEPAGPVQEVLLTGTGDGKVLLLDLSGIISSQDKDALIQQPNMVAALKEELTKATKDEMVKAVVLRINSPGGTVNASDILYHEIKTFKASR